MLNTLKKRKSKCFFESIETGRREPIPLHLLGDQHKKAYRNNNKTQKLVLREKHETFKFIYNQNDI
jgi:hypothetical protein